MTDTERTAMALCELGSDLRVELDDLRGKPFSMTLVESIVSTLHQRMKAIEEAFGVPIAEHVFLEISMRDGHLKVDLSPRTEHGMELLTAACAAAKPGEDRHDR